MSSHSTSLQAYLKEVSHHPILTRQEEIDLFVQMHDGVETAREEIVRCNLRFVIQLAQRFRSRGLPLEDLIQEGNLGLLEAIGKFDHTLGYRFSTYAAFWIRQSIQVAIRQRGSLIRIPVRKSRQLGFMNEVVQEFKSTLGRTPTDQELADRLDISKEHAQELARLGEAVLSLDTPFEEEGASLMDLIPDTVSQTTEDVALEHEREELLNNALSTLSERESSVLRYRFGLQNGTERSLRKVSVLTGLSQEGVRRVEQRAIGKLRRPQTRQSITSLL